MKMIAVAAGVVTVVVVAAAPAGAQTPGTKPVKTSSHIYSLSNSQPSTEESFYVNGSVKPSDYEHPVSFQMQDSTNGGHTWHSTGTHRSYGGVQLALKLTKAGTYDLRIVTLKDRRHLASVSNRKRITVSNPFPQVRQTGGSFDVATDRNTSERINVGTPYLDTSITTRCYVPADPASCSSDTPTRGEYVTVPITIAQTKGTHDYNVFNYELKGADGQVYDPTFEDTKHGQPLNSGSLTAPDLVSGEVVFDAPVQAGYRLLVEDFSSTPLGYVSF